jgi:RNA polymerase sigma factor (sigma-70 family)
VETQKDCKNACHIRLVSMSAEERQHGTGLTSGDHPASSALVERLFREHNEALIRFLRPRLRSQHEAREVAQEAYVRLLSLDKPGAVSYLRAFLFKTAANIAVDRIRHEETQARTAQAPLFHEFIDARTPERQVAARQAVQRLERLISAMPTKCRQAFLLNRVEGKDFAAIAMEMGLSERMVRTYVVRALLYCRERLDLEQTVLKKERKDD